MSEDDDNRTARAIRKGIEAARLDQQLKREAQAGQPPTFSGRTFDRDPEEVTDTAILRQMRRHRQVREALQQRKARRATHAQRNAEREDIAADDIRAQLVRYPNIDETNVDELLIIYEDRAQAKLGLRERGYSNAIAEAHLDRQGYPRPPGWHSVFYYPDSNRPRNTMVIWGLLIVGGGWLLFGSL